MRHLCLLVATIQIISMTVEASAQDIVADCSASVGHAYFPLVGLNTNDENGALRENGVAGFSADAISDGIIRLTRLQNGNYDLSFGSNPDALTSATQSGAKVFSIDTRKGSLTIVASYPRLVETYTFLIATSGPEVMWTTNKFDTPVIKAGLYRAYCSEMNIPKN